MGFQHQSDVCRGSGSSRADRFIEPYLRAAQAYMLISMPTGTSTIFGAFQAIRESSQLRWLPWSMSWRDCAGLKGRTGSNLTQVATLRRRSGVVVLRDSQILRSFQSPARPLAVISTSAAGLDPPLNSIPYDPVFHPCPDPPR